MGCVLIVTGQLLSGSNWSTVNLYDLIQNLLGFKRRNVIMETSSLHKGKTGRYMGQKRGWRI